MPLPAGARAIPLPFLARLGGGWGKERPQGAADRSCAERNTRPRPQAPPVSGRRKLCRESGLAVEGRGGVLPARGHSPLGRGGQGISADAPCPSSPSERSVPSFASRKRPLLLLLLFSLGRDSWRAGAGLGGGPPSHARHNYPPPPREGLGKIRRAPRWLSFGCLSLAINCNRGKGLSWDPWLKKTLKDCARGGGGLLHPSTAPGKRREGRKSVAPVSESLLQFVAIVTCI